MGEARWEKKRSRKKDRRRKRARQGGRPLAHHVPPGRRTRWKESPSEKVAGSCQKPKHAPLCHQAQVEISISSSHHELLIFSHCTLSVRKLTHVYV